MKKPIVLVIEENPELPESISHLLQSEEYHVITASDGKKGMQMALSNSPDLVVCDIALSESAGYEELNKIQKKAGKVGSVFLFPEPGSKKGKDTKVVVSTSQHTVKPFEPGKFLEMIAELLQKNNN